MSNVLPKVLLVSNNVLSDTTNNGKTLQSFFLELPEENITQIYFSEEVPLLNKKYRYYRISDKDVLISLIKKKKSCGAEYINKNEGEKQTFKPKSGLTLNKFSFLYKSQMGRIIREFFWLLNKGNNEALEKWIDDINPDVLFFCCGDSGFAYDIVRRITEKRNMKVCVYITDDYILPRKTINIFWWIRRNYVYKKMKVCIKSADAFYTISNEMRETYKDIFEKDSSLLINMCNSMLEEHQNDKSCKETIVTYAGGLHYNRYKSIALLVKALHEIREESNIQIKLNIYCNQRPSDRILKLIEKKDTSCYKGELDSFSLKKALNDSDILLHVESFDKKSIASTKLSVSTKIPEYLSLGKPILAIGPEEVASIKYIRDVALCISNKSTIKEELAAFLEDETMQSELGKKAIAKYEMDFVNINHAHELIIKMKNWII